MYVEMLTTCATPQGLLKRGHIYETDADGAKMLFSAGYARPTDTPPEWIRRFHERIERGRGEPCLFLPFVGEFGHQVMYHVRMVHFHPAAEKVVCCRPRDRVLYPSATSFEHNWIDPIPDRDKVGTHRGSQPEFPELATRYPDHYRIDGGGLNYAEELLCIEANQRIAFRPRPSRHRVDVVLSVRRRDFCPERNWRHWQQLADALDAAGYTFAVMGDKTTSFDLRGQQLHTGDHDTDLAITLLQRCSLYVGQDSGGSHLAATVGAPMLVFREEKGGSRDLTPRMEAINPGRVQVLRGAWESPDQVIATAVNLLRNELAHAA